MTLETTQRKVVSECNECAKDELNQTPHTNHADERWSERQGFRLSSGPFNGTQQRPAESWTYVKLENHAGERWPPSASSAPKLDVISPTHEPNRSERKGGGA